MGRLLKKTIYNGLAIATVLLMVSLAINVTTVLRVVNRPIETVVIHKADNAVKYKHASFTKHSIAQSWNVRGYLQQQSTD